MPLRLPGRVGYGKMSPQFQSRLMGINYSIDAGARIVRLIYVGETTLDELTATMRAIFRSPSYEPGFGFLADRRSVDPPTREYVEGIVAFMVLLRDRLVGSRWALVVAGPATDGMGRMGQTLANAGPVRVEVFTDIEKAERWLRAEKEA